MEGDLGSNLYTGTPVVPPPPDADSSSALAEVTLRTMASDIELLGETGGSAPTGTTVAVAVAERSGDAADGADADLPPPPSSGGFRTIFWSLAGIVAIVALFFGGYYVIPRLLGAPEETNPPIAHPTSTPTLPPSGQLGFVHRSFFVGPSDAIVTVSLGDPRIPEAVRGFSAQVLSLMKSASPAAVFFEIENVLPSGDAASWNEFASSTGLTLLPPELASVRFEPDFTAFAFRNARGVFPGYILKLKKGQTPLTLRAPVATAIELAGSPLAALFLPPLPAPTSTPAFRDAQVNNQPVRVVSFGSGADSPSVLYGWFFNTYLVISASEEGMRDAVGRL